MRTYERNGVVIDQCEECRGVFLDRGEPEQLLDAECGPERRDERDEREHDDHHRGHHDEDDTSEAVGAGAPAPPSSFLTILSAAANSARQCERCPGEGTRTRSEDVIRHGRRARLPRASTGCSTHGTANTGHGAT